MKKSIAAFLFLVSTIALLAQLGEVRNQTRLQVLPSENDIIAVSLENCGKEKVKFFDTLSDSCAEKQTEFGLPLCARLVLRDKNEQLLKPKASIKTDDYHPIYETSQVAQSSRSKRSALEPGMRIEMRFPVTWLLDGVDKVVLRKAASYKIICSVEIEVGQFQVADSGWQEVPHQSSADE